MSKKLGKGRPAIYTPELAEQICNVIASMPYSLKKMGETHDFFPDPSTIHAWRKEHPDFSDKYWRAKLIQADILAEEILDIADGCTADNYTQAKLRIDTRKWIASKLLPKQYGDKYLIEAKKDEVDQSVDEVLTIRAKLDAQNKRNY